MDLPGRAGLHDEPRLGAKPGPHQVVVHGAGREQGGDRDVRRVHRPVRQDEDVVVPPHRLFGLCTDPVHRRLHAGRALLRRVADVDGARVEPAARMTLDLPDRVQLAIGEDRLLDLDPVVAGRVVEIQQVRPRPDDRDERRDELLADRVDGRIRDLGEVLPEVVGERLRMGGEHRHRIVRPHRPDRLLRGLGHRGQEELDVLAGIAERLLALEQRLVRGRLRVAVGRQILEPDLSMVQPLLPRTRGGQLGLELGVVDDPPPPKVNEQHPPRLEPPLADDAGFGDGHRPDLGRHDQPVVVRHHVAGRPESVPVESRPDLAPVRERDRGGAVPRLHDRRVILVERPARVVHERVVLPRLRDHQHHRVGERVTPGEQQLQGVVEGRGIRNPLLDDGPQLVEIVPQ